MNHEPPKSGIPKRKKTEACPRLSCKIEYLLTSNHRDQSTTSEYFTDDSVTSCDLNKLWRATGYSKALRRLAGANAAAATAVKAVTGEFPEGSIALIAFVADRMSYADYGRFPVADAESAHRYIAPMVSCGNVTPDKPPVHAGGLFRFRSDMIGIFTLGRGLLVARGGGSGSDSGVIATGGGADGGFRGAKGNCNVRAAQEMPRGAERIQALIKRASFVTEPF